MKKVRFIAANKAIGWTILAVLISIATISMLGNLDTAWLRFLVVMTLTKVIWHCLERARWTWGIYVSKKPNNMYINSMYADIHRKEKDIELHLDLYAPSENTEEDDAIEAKVFKAMNSWLSSVNLNGSKKENEDTTEDESVEHVDAEIVED